MPHRIVTVAALLFALLLSQVVEAGVDPRQRMREIRAGGTRISRTQANDLTLTMTEAAVRPIQTWVRTVGVVNADGKTIVAHLRRSEAGGVAVGQRTRSFAANARTQMHPGKIVRVSPEAGGVLVQASLVDQGHTPGARYLMEIIVERGPYLSIPNASIIHEEGVALAYVLKIRPDYYLPQAIHTGIQGDSYTQISDGLAEGDQVVSIGSFFVDAEQKLRGSRELLGAICHVPATH